MDLESTKELLELLKALGINSAAIVNRELGDGSRSYILYGRDDQTGSIIVYEPNTDHFDADIRFPNIKDALTKINLFDLGKATLNTVKRGEFITALKIKSEGMEATLRMANPSMLKIGVPTKTEVAVKIELDRDESRSILSALSAYKPKTVELRAEDGELVMSFSDQVGNDFYKVVGSCNGDDWEYFYHTNVIETLIRESIKYEGRTEIGILSETGFLTTTIGGVFVYGLRES